MLQKLNEHLQGVVSWIIVILITITFTIFGIDYFLANRHSADSVVVKINNQDISKRDFEINLRRILQLKDRDGSLSEHDEREIKKQVLDNMIANTVTVQEALKNGFFVSNEQANAAILSVPQFQENGQFSNNRYSQVITNAFYTHESFQEEVKKGMLLNQQRFALVGTEFALPGELEQFVKLYMQKRDYRYIVLPVTSFKSNTDISDKDIEDYYNSHAQKYYYPERISLQYVALSAQAIRNKISISDEQILRHYEENKSSYLSPAKWKVAKILLKSDENKEVSLTQKAADLAKYLQENPDKFEQKYQEINGNKSNSNAMFLNVVAGATAFDKYLLELNTENPVSSPITTQDGVVILKLLEYSPATTRAFAEVRDTIKEQLIVETVQTEYAAILEKLADLSYQTPDSLDMVSKALGLKLMQTELFDKRGGSTDLTKNKALLNAAFSYDVLKLGNNSEPLQIDNDKVVVIRVSKRIPVSKIPLAELKEEISKLISLNRSKKLAKQFGEDLIAKQAKLSQLEPVELAGKQINWVSVNDAARDNSQANYFINELAFSIIRPNQLAGKLFSEKKYVVVSLDKIKDGDLGGLDTEQVNSISQQLESGYGLNDYNSYINGLMNQAKIVRKHENS